MALPVSKGTMPQPKRKLLQTGSRPRHVDRFQDPEAPLKAVAYHRTLVSGNAGAMPAEAYQYDLVYNEFLADKAFWKNWRVVNCARSSTEESLSQKNAYIRVVMDLPTETKLYPTAYTPGFRTLPRDMTDESLEGEVVEIPGGLPEGYSVALDVYILEDARILLQHQRAFRGRVDENYKWLDAIVNPDLCRAEEAALAALPAPETQLMLTDGSQSGRQQTKPVPDEDLPLSCFTACPRGLAKDPTLDRQQLADQRRRREVHAENAIINAFGDHVGLPPRDDGKGWGSEPTRTSAGDFKALHEAEEAEKRLQRITYTTAKP